MASGNDVAYASAVSLLNLYRRRELSPVEATRLILVAATIGDPASASGPGAFAEGGAYAPAGLRPQLRGSLTVSGEGGSSLVVDGLVIDGDVIADDGELGSLTLSQCTVAGAVRVGQPGGAGNPGLAVRLVRGIAGQVGFGPAAASLELLDSIVDAAAVPDAGDGASSRAEDGAGDPVAAAAQLLDPYLPAGMQLGVVGPLASG